MLQLCINVFTGSNFKYVNNFIKYWKFYACSINRSIFTEFLNELCSRVKFKFCAHMKQIPFSKVLFHFCSILSIPFTTFPIFLTIQG